jgi:hypothetical protein
MADQRYADAIASRKADHRTVEELFEQFEKARGDERKRALAHQICAELMIHTMIAEEIWSRCATRCSRANRNLCRWHKAPACPRLSPAPRALFVTDALASINLMFQPHGDRFV